MFNQQTADLENERRKCSFSVDELSCVFAGGKSERDRRRWLMSLVRSEPAFSRQGKYYQGRTQRVIS